MQHLQSSARRGQPQSTRPQLWSRRTHPEDRQRIGRSQPCTTIRVELDALHGIRVVCNEV